MGEILKRTKFSKSAIAALKQIPDKHVRMDIYRRMRQIARWGVYMKPQITDFGIILINDYGENLWFAGEQEDLKNGR